MSDEKPVVGVVGCGFVGNAVATGFAPIAQILRCDRDTTRGPHSLQSVADKADVIFICVPTPTSSQTGVQNQSCLQSVVGRLADLTEGRNPIVVIKSTVEPGTTDRLALLYPWLTFVANPEFLTERTAVEDFKHPAHVVVGGPTCATQRVLNLYNAMINEQLLCCNECWDLQTTALEAEMIKYASNCFFAAKIAFFNELRQIAFAAGANFETIRHGIIASGWVHPMHTQAPGPDGRLGFGGKCFPKDIAAFATYARKIGVHPTMLEAAIKKNLELRPERDWEQIEGAITL